MAAHMLSCDHRRSSRHAHDVLIVRAVIVNAAASQRIDYRGFGKSAAVAAKRVIALLIGRDKENFTATTFGIFHMSNFHLGST